MNFVEVHTEGAAPYKILHGDALEYLWADGPHFNTIFVDPPDNIGLKYDGYTDKIKNYAEWLRDLLLLSVVRADTVWLSFNVQHILDVSAIVKEHSWNWKPCVQTFTFGQNNKHDLSNSHRPLWRIAMNKPPLYPDSIKVESWRQANGDKRATAGGKVPGDVFDFPRVTGNNKQRRAWHKTQLHEGLVERCLRLSTPEGGSVLDLCSGTGTTLRVCKRIGFDCTSIEKSQTYYDELIKEHTS